MNMPLRPIERIRVMLLLALVGLCTTIPVRANDCIDNLSVRPKTGVVQLVWSHAPSALSYDVLRGTSLQSIDTVVANTTSTYSTWLDGAVEAGNTYYYRIRRIEADGECLSDPIASYVPTRRREALTRVPDVVGNDEPTATAALEGATLVVGPSSEADDESAAPGTVLIQDPPARSVVAEGSGANLVVAGTPAPDIVPLEIVVDDTSTVRAEIGSEGGSLSIGDVNGFEYELVVPAGAVEIPTEFSMTNVLSIDNLPPEIEPVAAVALGPAGAEFPIAVGLKVTIPAAVRDGRALSALKARDDGTDLALNPLIGTSIEGAAFSDLEVTVPLTGFSVGILAKIFAELDRILELINQLLENLKIGQRPYETRVTQEMVSLLQFVAAKQMLGLEPDVADQQEILRLHSEWLNGHPVDNPLGWRTYAANLDDQQLLDLLLLKRLIGERFRIVQAGQMIGVEGDDVAAALDDSVDLIEAFLRGNKARCEEDTLAAQAQYKSITEYVVSVSADSQQLSDLASRLARGDRQYECGFSLTLSPKQGFLTPGEISTIDFTATLDDGSVYEGDIPGLYATVGDDEHPDAIFRYASISVSEGSFAAQRPLQFDVLPDAGASRVRVTASTGGEPVVASIVAVPDLLGSYTATGDGFAECASDPEAGGPGNFGETITFRNVLVQIFDDPLGVARITIESAGTVVTSLTFSADIERRPNGSIDVTGVSGSASYFYEEEDVDDEGNPVTITVSGSGVFTGGSGSITDFQSNFALRFVGSDNFCERVEGTVTLNKL